MKFIHLETVDSTNSEIKRLAADGADEWTVVTAKKQTAGRGRLGRSFYSPEGTGLYMSVLLRPERTADAALITVAAAVAVAEAVSTVLDLHLDIKWVNDLLLDGKKVCGILTEGAADDGGLLWVVLGIGINLSLPAGGMPDELKDIAGALCDRVSEEKRNTLICDILNRFKEYYERLDEKEYYAAYRERLCLLGREIFVVRDGDFIPATAVDLDGDFKLVVQYPSGEREALSFGEVSVKIENKN